MPKRSEIIKKIRQTLDPERFGHSLRVEKTALQLGKTWGAPGEKVSLAALLHDCSRHYDKREMRREAEKLGLKMDSVRKFEPKLFHAELSACVAEKEFGIKSPDVLRAISLHTTGAENMSLLDKIIYLADHIEEGRDFQGISKLRKLAFKNLDQAVMESINCMLKYLLENNLPIYSETVKTRNYLLMNA